MFLNLLFTFIYFNQIIRIICDCGLPALPVHMKVTPFTSVYLEDDVIQYYCESEDMHLIGNNTRQCSQSRWKGEIPHCVREISRLNLDRIEVLHIKNHSISNIYNKRLYYYYNYNKDNNKYQKMTFYGNYDKSPNECLRSKLALNVTKLEWSVVFKRPVSQIYQVQIVIYNQNLPDKIDLQKTESVISNVMVGGFRECRPQNVENTDLINKLYTYSFICQLKSAEEDHNYLRFESLNNITINFALNDVIVCELHICQTLPVRSFNSGSCGSPDVPLFANYSPVYDQLMHSAIPMGYTFACDQGFHLEGNPTITCGLNNKWMDTFPTCIPDKTCEMMTNSRLKEQNLLVNYKNLYSFDGNITSINGTQAIYTCNTNINLSNLTLIGDSIRFCQTNGNWSGEEPVCLERNDFTFYLSELNEDILKHDPQLPNFAKHLHQIYSCNLPAIPKFAKVFTYDSELLNIYMANYQERIDLMPSYENGSIITYHCDSKFDYMANDFEARTCINGSWQGPIGKCYDLVGGSDITKVVAIQVFHKKENVIQKQKYIPIPSETNDPYWNYIEKDNTKCVSLEIENGLKINMNIYLSFPVKVSYFVLRFEAKNIFSELDDKFFGFYRASQLQSLPITASIDQIYFGHKSECYITRVIETNGLTNHPPITIVSLKCDETDSESRLEKRPHDINSVKTSTINVDINPNQFHMNFNLTNITFCGIMLFESMDDCGLPENVVNAEIISGSNKAYVRYKCKNGYKLIGNEYVRCGPFGNWKDQFPRCQLYKLCEIRPNNSSDLLKRKYYNTLLIDNEEVAVLGTIVEYECGLENLVQGLHIMIGPRTAICTENGQWSVNEPICADDKYFGHLKTSKFVKQSVIIPIIIGFTVIIVMIVIIIIIYRRYGCSHSLQTFISRRKANHSSTFIGYGQSNLRESVSSFHDSFSSINNQSTA